MKNRLYLFPLVLAACSVSMPGFVGAQTNVEKDSVPQSRMQVRMDRDEFLKTHRFEEPLGVWMLKSGVEPPTGIKSRVSVKAERDNFLRNNRWDNVTTSWVPIRSVPRDLSTLSRQQVKMETAQFVRTHEFDEVLGVWSLKPSAMKK